MRKKQAEIPLVITARDCSRCPAFESGQKVSLMGRCILRSGTTANCAFLMSNIKPLISSLESNINPLHFGIDISQGTFHCRDTGCFASFRVRQLKMSELKEIYSTQSDNILNYQKSSNTIWNLDKDPFIRKLDIEFTGRLLRNAVIEKYSKGSVIIKKGLKCNHLFIVDKGEARALLNEHDGDSLLYPAAILDSGEVFGEVSLVFSKPSPYSVIASTDMTVWKLPYEDLTRTLMASNELKKQFSEALTGRLSKQNYDLFTMLKSGEKGQLFFFSMIDIIQHLSLSGISGSIVIEKDSIMRGFLNFEDGNCFHAEYENKIGLEALMNLVNIRYGNFYYRSKLKRSSRSLEGDIIPLLVSMSNIRTQDNKGAG
ncbi:MAG: cyclic nucleotide-binding domain-containing protein [Planctomycetota bacterium]|jgi:uncharacterized repeat protein (TIGR04076 family)